MVRLGFLWSLAFILGACGGSSKKSSTDVTNKARASGDVLRSLDCSVGGGAGDNQALALAGDEEIRRVPAEDLMVLQGKAVISFCDIMRANPEAKLGLFMFTSPSCYKCQKWIETVAGGLGALGNTVLPVAVVAESQSALSEADLDELKEQVASDIIWVRDPGRDVWKFFATDADAQARLVPTILEMDTAARGFVVEDTALEAKNLIDHANTALGLGLGSGS